MPKAGVVLAFLIVVPLTSAMAQGESGDVHLRNRCRQYAEYLEVGPRHPLYERALSGIGACDASGGMVLGALWREVSDEDSVAVGRLGYESARLRDHALLDSLLVQISDEIRSPTARMEMLNVLVSYYAPAHVLPWGARRQGIDPSYCTLGGEMDFEATEGATPITDADRPRILEAIRSLAATDADPFIRSAAACTAAALALVGGSG